MELEPRVDRNVLCDRVKRILLRIATNPNQKGSEATDRLNQMSSLLRRIHSPRLQAIYQKALSAHQIEHAELKKWITHLSRVLRRQDVNKTYQELYRLKLSLEVYVKLLDRNQTTLSFEKLIAILNKVLKKFQILAHPDSQDIGLVQEMVSNLPPVARLLLKNDFNLSKVAPNPPTKTLASLMKQGELKSIRLLSLLSPLCDFILNSRASPESIRIKTWQRDSVKTRGRDFLPAQRWSDLPRAILTQPSKSAEQNMQEDTAFIPTTRRIKKLPAGRGIEEIERITILLYDTSSSMYGSAGLFQAALISAFTAKALSDVSPRGRHRHRILIVPFDKVPGKPIYVTNTQEALDVLRA